MAAKAVLILCLAQVLLIQSISAQCIGAAYPAIAAAPIVAAPIGAGVGYAGIGCGAWETAPAARGLAASNGAGIAIASASPIPPVGVSVASENVIEGAVAVVGALPFLGTVGLEGVLPTAGAGAVSYNCGSGAVGIIAEDIAAAPIGIAGPIGYGVGPIAGSIAGPIAGAIAGPIGYGYGIGAPIAGIGCGAFI